MTVITHLAVGAAVGSFTDNAAGAAALGLVSHVPLDILPHYEFERMWVEVAAVAAVFVAMFAAGMAGTGVFWGAVGAVVPDLENLFWRIGLLPGERKIFPGHSLRLSRVLPHGRALGPRHALTQVAIVCASLAVVLLSLRHGAN
uniref:Uncharacterized protein n=1 Tax=uncultured Latescibacterota bacterium TaxID=199737 RepID=Q2Z0E4_9BACT|nr:hypothetical protein [uncultured Latescibacterota bacterium]